MIAWTQHLRITGEEPAAPIGLRIYDSAQDEQVTLVVVDPAAAVEGTMPLVGMEVSIGANSWRTDSDQTGASLTVTESVEGTTWELALPLDRWPYAAGVLPTDTVSIVGLWGRPGARSSATLLTDGRVSTVRRSWSPEGRTVTVSGLDASGHYDARTISGTWTPGEYTWRRDVVAAILVEAGYTGPVIGSSDRHRVSLQATEEGVVTLLRRLLEVEHQTVRFDRAGRASIVPITWTTGVPLSGSLTLEDLTAEGQGEETGDGPDGLELTVEVPATEGAGSAEGEREVEELTIDTSGLRITYGANWRQEPGEVGVEPGAGDVVAIAQRTEQEIVQGQAGGAHPEGSLPLTRVQLYRVRDRGETIYERRRTWGWLWPLAWRYQLTAQVAWSPHVYNVVYFRADSVAKDDRQVGYIWPTPRFVLTGEQVTSRAHDDNDELLAEAVRVSGWQTIPAALKLRVSPTDDGVPWEELAYLAAYELGNGSGVASLGPRSEHLGVVSLELTDVQGVDGEITSEVSAVHRYRGEFGQSYLYGDGEVWADQEFTFGLDEVVSETPIPAGAGSHQLLTVASSPLRGVIRDVLGPVQLHHRPPRPAKIAVASATPTRTVELAIGATTGRVESATIAAGSEEEGRAWGVRELARRRARTASATTPAGSILRRTIGQAVTLEEIGSGLILGAVHRASPDGMTTALNLEVQ